MPKEKEDFHYNFLALVAGKCQISIDTYESAEVGIALQLKPFRDVSQLSSSSSSIMRRFIHWKELLKIKVY